MVLINRIDRIPKTEKERNSEKQMIISTAADFLGATTESDKGRVFPTSAFQGLCNLQMGKLLDKIEVEIHDGMDAYIEKRGAEL